ncbi:MAG: M48 family metallopeptidase [Pseudomonadales bacterium]|nr:M48 family metallopeptidase [Pseudomonadales bacterium]
MIIPFEYTHKTNKNSKSLRLKIEQDGKIIVISPKFVPKFIIDHFVKKNQQWILDSLKKTSKSKKFDSEQFTFIFGKKYQKKIIYSADQKSGVYVRGDKIIFNPIAMPITMPITMPKKSSAKVVTDLNKKFKKKIDDFLKSSASHYIVKRTHELAKSMNLSFNKITLKNQKTRWGSCSSQKNLNFNWRLAHFDTSIIDYVIIHELSHLVHMNHSKQFWDFVKQYDQEYLKHKGWLNRNGLSLD